MNVNEQAASENLYLPHSSIWSPNIQCNGNYSSFTKSCIYISNFLYPDIDLSTCASTSLHERFRPLTRFVHSGTQIVGIHL